MMPLKLANIDEKLTIQRISGNEELKKHLSDLGFVPGTDLKVVAKTNGNMIVNIKNARIAIGEQTAMKIFI
ncbi:MAG TPA: ferrous iron transport protein A [Ruminococcaceae bacterium]|nr:ferrous iron transport protein A [Oscillospiraceae bacterium]